MNLKEEMQEKRKNFLGLTEFNTEKVYNTIFEVYNEKLSEAPRNIIDFAINIVICNMNYYNRLGKIEELNRTWGDKNFYIDLKNSSFVQMEVNEDGEIEGNSQYLEFKNLDKLKCLDNISFSLKEFIELCKKDNFDIKLYSKEYDNYGTTIEITTYLPFKLNESIDKYLKTIK